MYIYLFFHQKNIILDLDGSYFTKKYLNINIFVNKNVVLVYFLYFIADIIL